MLEWHAAQSWPPLQTASIRPMSDHSQGERISAGGENGGTWGKPSEAQERINLNFT
jgi:hypothetical protein